MPNFIETAVGLAGTMLLSLSVALAIAWGVLRGFFGTLPADAVATGATAGQGASKGASQRASKGASTRAGEGDGPQDERPSRGARRAGTG